MNTRSYCFQLLPRVHNRYLRCEGPKLDNQASCTLWNVTDVRSLDWCTCHAASSSTEGYSSHFIRYGFLWQSHLGLISQIAALLSWRPPRDFLHMSIHQILGVHLACAFSTGHPIKIYQLCLWHNHLIFCLVRGPLVNSKSLYKRYIANFVYSTNGINQIFRCTNTSVQTILDVLVSPCLSLNRTLILLGWVQCERAT